MSIEIRTAYGRGYVAGLKRRPREHPPEIGTGKSTQEHIAAEVQWYKLNGKNPERIYMDSAGRPYVIGDAAWAVLHPEPKPWEYVEQIEYHMRRALAAQRAATTEAGG